MLLDQTLVEFQRVGPGHLAGPVQFVSLIVNFCIVEMAVVHQIMK